ncbi:phage tail length tape measure family protein, partial [Mesorhizobium sp.]|uniref:phage tail length tape measure family protein n=1 Tax=Mesorhizobium sp. TaxID=1871066 RepID=UPI0025C6700F
ANDIITMAALGAPASQIAFSQGGQILQNLQMGEGGIAGSLKAIKGSAAEAGTALVGMLGTTGLIATGFGVAALAAGAFYLATREKTKDLNEALKEERQAIADVAKAYDLAKVNADNYNKSNGIFAAASARKGQTDLGNSARSEDIDVLDSLARFVVPGYHQAGHYEARSQFSAFDDVIRQYAKGVGAGNPDYDALAKGVRDVVAQNPRLQETGDKILNIAKAGADAAGSLKEAADTLARINSRAPSLSDARLGQDYRDQNEAQLYWLQQQRAASLLGV